MKFKSFITRLLSDIAARRIFIKRLMFYKFAYRPTFFIDLATSLYTTFPDLSTFIGTFLYFKQRLLLLQSRIKIQSADKNRNYITKPVKQVNRVHLPVL